MYPKNIMKIIREKYVNNPYFDPNLVKKVATACEGLCRWVRAIEVYDRVIKIVSPKKAKLAEAGNFYDICGGRYGGDMLNINILWEKILHSSSPFTASEYFLKKH